MKMSNKGFRNNAVFIGGAFVHKGKHYSVMGFYKPEVIKLLKKHKLSKSQAESQKRADKNYITMLKKEQKEHPELSKTTVEQIVEDHTKK